jgi:hypothetical protein
MTDWGDIIQACLPFLTVAAVLVAVGWRSSRRQQRRR